jgi:hypothetical protein
VKEWLRRVDPGFYFKEPLVLRAVAQIERYTEDEQAQVRLEVLRADSVLHATTAIVALALYAAATGAGSLDPRREWPTLWALAAIAVAAPRALPWWPRRDRTPWRAGLIGSALIVISTLWTGAYAVVLGTAVLVGVTLVFARGRLRAALLVVAVGVACGWRMAAHPLVAPLVAILAAGASVIVARIVAMVSRTHPQAVASAALATILVASAWIFAFNAAAAARRVPIEIVAIGVAYLGVCVIAGRIRRAELLARPRGMLTIPQSIVPLLDRSHDHAVICFRRD